MEDPTLNPEIVYRPREFSDEIVKARIRQLVDKINNEVMGEDEEEMFIEEASHQIAELLDVDFYIGGMVDVLAHASYTGPDEDEQTGEPELFSAQDMYFDGVKLIRPSGEGEYKALLVFSEAQGLPLDDNDDDTIGQKFYFVEPDELVFLDPGAFERFSGVQLKEHFERYAVQSEIVVNSTTFKSATGEEQRRMLIMQAEKASEFIQSQYEGDTIMLDVDTCTMMWPSDDGSSIQHITPASSGNRLTQIVGTPAGCTFVELVSVQSWQKPLTKLVYNHPSMIIHDKASGVLYMVPLRAINSIEVIKAQF